MKAKPANPGYYGVQSGWRAGACTSKAEDKYRLDSWPDPGSGDAGRSRLVQLRLPAMCDSQVG